VGGKEGFNDNIGVSLVSRVIMRIKLLAILGSIALKGQIASANAKGVKSYSDRCNRGRDDTGSLITS